MDDRRAAPRANPRSEARFSDLLRLVRAPAALSVPGDVLAGAAAAGTPWTPRALGATASSVCLYWAGMALNDYADAAVDAVERPGRPVPSGRVPRRTALVVATGLTAAGIALSALTAGRRGLLGTLPLTACVWAYDLGLKATPAGPAAMAGARALDVLTGALATTPGTPATTALRRAAAPAALIGAHTYTLTALSRHEVGGAPARLPASTLAASMATAAATAVRPVLRAARGSGAVSGKAVCAAAENSAQGAGKGVRDAVKGVRGAVAGFFPDAPGEGRTAAAAALVAGAAALAYVGSYGSAQLKAVRAPSGENVRGAVGAGILALLPLQAALTARAGAPGAAAALGVAHPLAARLARRISPT